MSKERIEVYPDRAGEWRWRKVAANNEPTASGESYTTRSGAWEAAERERRGTPELPIYEVEGES